MSADNALDAFQLSAKRTTNPSLNTKERLLDAAAGLAEESGEVLSHVRKHVMQSKPLDRDALTLELGDALWCLALVAATADISLSEVARRNEEKLSARHPGGFAPAEKKAES